MAQLLVRDLDDNVRQWLRERGARNGRSMEAEARDVLTRARRTDVEDPIGRILTSMQGRGVKPVDVPDQKDHDAASFS
ncbi:hypothetical protein CFK38_04260 [Brachybacterium vulturis]|uniref:Antitoxin FitA-like ribbon-helix-helix domain-containing protein n=1 Tax=Brachybacterium vulturis TaxID=2017484 RepID=A0A291GJX9_9MICO|nr:hypothetical protein [Brachybacterium vulturis]ATG50823.1 hypothetical protein CFK38_04260 [Brachybacterium vulturis]